MRDWHSGCLPFTTADLAGRPPLLLVNLSLHGLRRRWSLFPLLEDQRLSLAELLVGYGPATEGPPRGRTRRGMGS